MKIIRFALLMVLAGAVVAMAADNASDNAGNYTTATWTNNSNGGSGFQAWSLSTSGGDAYHWIGDSAAEGAQSVGNPAFGITGGDYVHANRNLQGGALNNGQIFSVEMNFNWNGVNHGLDCFSDTGFSSKIMNIGHGNGSDALSLIIGTTTNILVANVYRKAVNLSFRQIDATTVNISAQMDGTEQYNADHTVSGAVQGLGFYAGGRSADDPNYNMYFNNMSVTAIPEPSSLLLMSGALGLIALLRRRLQK